MSALLFAHNTRQQSTKVEPHLRALADAQPRDVDHLARHKVHGVQRRARRQQAVGCDPKLTGCALQRDPRLFKVTTEPLAQLLGALGTRAHLERGVALVLFRLDLHDLHVVHPEHGEGDAHTPCIPLLREVCDGEVETHA